MDNKSKLIKKIEEVFAKLPKATYKEVKENYKKENTDKT